MRVKLRVETAGVDCDLHEALALSNLREGDRLVVRPVPADPIEALRGVLKEYGRADISVSEAMQQWREEDNAAMERKWREHYEE